jgi:hypothetical protein
VWKKGAQHGRDSKSSEKHCASVRIGNGEHRGTIQDRSVVDPRLLPRIAHLVDAGKLVPFADVVTLLQTLVEPGFVTIWGNAPVFDVELPTNRSQRHGHRPLSD